MTEGCWCAEVSFDFVSVSGGVDGSTSHVYSTVDGVSSVDSVRSSVVSGVVSNVAERSSAGSIIRELRIDWSNIFTSFEGVAKVFLTMTLSSEFSGRASKGVGVLFDQLGDFVLVTSHDDDG